MVTTAGEAVAGTTDRTTLAVGGSGLAGIPWTLVDAVLAGGATDREVVPDDCGVDGAGPGLLLSAGPIRRGVASSTGEDRESARRHHDGELRDGSSAALGIGSRPSSPSTCRLA